MGTDPETDRAPVAPPIRVLLIDDDEDDRFLTEERLDDAPGKPYRLDWTPHYAEGLEAICAGTHDVYLLDFRLGARTGIELLREARARGRSAPVILFTGQALDQTDFEALDAGADDYLEKAGLTSALLDRSIRYALAQSRAAAELEQKVRERTEELAKANDALREADRRKDEFLALLAHELRNPLTPIINALEILRLANDTGDTVRRQRERMERQVAQLKRLVEDLLDVSRITTGKLRLTPERLTIQELVESAIDMSRSQIEAAKLELVASIPAEPVVLTGDRVRLTQVFCNVLNNAAKFTDPGGKVWVTVQPVAGARHRHRPRHRRRHPGERAAPTVRAVHTGGPDAEPDPVRARDRAGACAPAGRDARGDGDRAQRRARYRGHVRDPPPRYPTELSHAR
jgi:signal transduction histidine kinase